ncbi:hypothetical protein AB0L99_38515 [Streptomyces sp. NPDC051954]|uniref:hypothetical protein n=1 Tax=Streptomyces sp. NPDC051954 TaxID=3155524 RepID=UPI003414978D
MTGFGATSYLPFALLLLALAGLGDLISDTLRVARLWMIQATVSPALGNAAAGFLAELTSARTAVITGGLVCVLATLVVAAAFPSLRRARLAPTPGADSREASDADPADPSDSVASAARTEGPMH